MVSALCETAAHVANDLEDCFPTGRSRDMETDFLVWFFFFFLVSAACLVSIKNTIWQESNLRNQHPGLREELCPQNYSVLSTSLTGNFSSLSQLLISISKHTPEEKFHLTASSAAGQHCFLFLLPMPSILKIFEGFAVLKSFF